MRFPLAMPSRPCAPCSAQIPHSLRMASIRKHNSKWRAEVFHEGRRRSKVLATRREAADWAARTEYELRNADKIAGAMSLGEAFDKYAREVSPKKRGHRWEVIRLERLAKDKVAKIVLRDLKPADFASWRDRRLPDVKPATVRREMELMGAVLTVAVREWGALSESPLKGVKRPPPSPARDRLPTEDELKRIGFCAGNDLENATARAFHAFLFAVETGMRAGEICKLTWEHTHLDRRFCHLPETKNGTKRDVPLSSRAVELIEALPRHDPVFNLTVRQIDVLWRKSRDKAGVKDLTFHDSRHAAITRLSKRLDVLELAKMVGHRNISELMTYYEADAESMAKKLD